MASNVKATYTVPAERNVITRMNAGEIIMGDGGFVFALEKRGYVKAGPWTPEAVCEHPDAVKQLHREFLRAGSDVMQTFTFYASDDKLQNRGNDAGAKFTCKGINKQACKIAREVAKEGEKDQLKVMVAGGISQTPTYLSGGGKEATCKQFREQVVEFVSNEVDFLLAEYYEHIEETEWAIETCLESGLPVAASMCIGPEGDLHGNSPEVCAVRMAKAGAKIVGINCHFGPVESVECMRKMAKALEAEGLKFHKEKNPNGVHMMVQPLGFLTPDAGKQGFIDLPEFPFGLEPRICTRWDMQKFARDCHDIGVLYIGGCCGFEPYHIRACSDELSQERGRRPLAAAKWIPGAGGLEMHTKPWVRARATQDYWNNLKCASGRPDCPCVSKPMNWGVTQGDDSLKQQKSATTQEELKDLQCKLVPQN